MPMRAARQAILPPSSCAARQKASRFIPAWNSRSDMPLAVAGPELEALIELLARLPGLGPRSARRAALQLIRKKDQLLVPLAAAFSDASTSVKVCTNCGSVDTSDPCAICSDPSRDPALIVVVED